MYLGVDQSLQSTGVAVLGVDGALRHLDTVRPGKLRDAARLTYIRDVVASLVREYRPVLAALEGYSYESVNKAFALGEVGGVLRACFYDNEVPLVVVPPSSLKLFVAGNGQASKTQVQDSIRRKWHLSIKQNDMSDAYGLAQVARVVVTRDTVDRHELEVVTALEKTKTPARIGTRRILDV
jgi:Holliday junction resolvasome RuvABC endonuclease subunit